MSRPAGSSAEDYLKSSGGVRRETALQTHAGVRILRGFTQFPRFTYKAKASFPLHAYRLTLTVACLAVVFVALRCFHFGTPRFGEGHPTRWLAGGGDEPCQSGWGAQEGEEAELSGLRHPRRWVGELGSSGTPPCHVQQERVSTLRITNALPDAQTREAGADRIAGSSRHEGTYGGNNEWREQLLSQSVRLQLVNLFMTMENASHCCASLLPVLKTDQALRLAFKVLRVFALELGALAIVPSSFQHLRLRAGQALISLAYVSLHNGGICSTHERVCQELHSLAGLVAGIREPSFMHLQTPTRLLHIKLSAIVNAGVLVIGFSLNVLLGLSQHASGSSQGLPPALVEQQLAVLDALAEAHGSIIVRDTVVRHHISTWQRHRRVWLLLSEEQFRLRRAPLPSTSSAMQTIIDAVEGAGGLLPPPPKTLVGSPVVMPGPWQGGWSTLDSQENNRVPCSSDSLGGPPFAALSVWNRQQQIQVAGQMHSHLQDIPASQSSGRVVRTAVGSAMWMRADSQAPAESRPR